MTNPLKESTRKQTKTYEVGNRRDTKRDHLQPAKQLRINFQMPAPHEFLPLFSAHLPSCEESILTGRLLTEWPEKKSDDIIDSPAYHPQWLLQIRLCSLGRNCTSDAPRLVGRFIRYWRQNCNCGSLHAHRFVSPRTLDFELPHAIVTNYSPPGTLAARKTKKSLGQAQPIPQILQVPGKRFTKKL